MVERDNRMDDRDIDESSASCEQAFQVHDDSAMTTKALGGVAVSLTLDLPEKEGFMSDTHQRVVVLGASKNPERYSNMAVNRLLENGHEVIPVHPALERVNGVTVIPSLGNVNGPVDSVTVYVSPKVSSKMIESLVAVAPGRVIFNPGAENPELEAVLQDQGIPTLRACTLVLLSTGQF